MTDIAVEIRRGIRVLGYATVGLYLIVFATLGYGWRESSLRTRELRAEERRTTSALCTLRADLQARARASQLFLAAHPNGIPGVPASVIRQGLVGQTRTVRALIGLNCR